MTDLLNVILSENGLIGLAAVAGWAMWWFERKDRLRKDAELGLLVKKTIRINLELKYLLEGIKNERKVTAEEPER